MFLGDREQNMFLKVTIGVWLISTLVFFYFFIFDASKESETSRIDRERGNLPRD